jgi:FKBP-type peptidyl-prolyl cis-trans isomerase FkpA
MATASRVVLVSLALTAVVGGTFGCSRRSAPAVVTEQERALYGVGLVVGRNVSVFNLTPDELEIVKAGLTDAVLKRKPLVDLDKDGAKVNDLAQARQKATATLQKQKSKGALEAAAREPGAFRTPSGLVIRTVTPGTGETPRPEDRVKVHYAGKLVDGTEFDNSRKRGRPDILPLTQVILCWTEGIGRMKVGERAILTCPSEIAYGDGGRPPQIPGGATLIFDIDLLGIEKAESPASPPLSSAADHSR